MTHSKTTRRAFLRTTSLAGGFCLAGGPEQPRAIARGRTAAANATVRVRPNIASLRPDGPEIASLRKGVQVMKTRRYDDPTSWIYQAAIHGVNASYYYWNQCKHGSWWFLPWHRLYLYYFERILRAASGDDALVVPYWNWDDSTDPSRRAIPVALRVPDNETANPLYDPWRNPVMNTASQPALPTDFNPAYALGLADFIETAQDGFGGQALGALTTPQSGHGLQPHGALERYPHDPIHTQVGGTLFVNGRFYNGHMALPETAALDPLFWMHHANIDRLWNVWRRQDPQNHLDPTNDATWMNQTFPFFDENKNATTKAVSDALDTVSNLGYRYDDDPPTPPAVRSRRRRSEAGARKEEHPLPKRELAEAVSRVAVGSTAAGKNLLGSSPTTVSVPLRAGLEADVHRLSRAPFDLKQKRPSFLLAIEGIKFDVDPGAPFGVYLNLPDDRIQPCPGDVHFAGVISFFGLHAPAQGHARPVDKKAAPPKPADPKDAPFQGGGTFTLNVSQTIAALDRLDLWDPKNLKVTFIRHDPISPGGRPKAFKEARYPTAVFERVSLLSGQDSPVEEPKRG